MTTNADKTLPRQALGRQDVDNDISALLRLPQDSLHSLRALTSDTSVTQATPVGTAIEELQAYTPSNAAPEQSLKLSKAYIADMKAAREWEDGRIEKLGEQVDKLRREGEDIKDALQDVKL